MTEKRDREGNEADVLVFRPRSADEALRAREVLAGVGVELEMPEAAIQTMFAEGKESIELRVPLERADAATAAVEEAFGADRLPSNEDGRNAGLDMESELAAIEARAREMEEEDERRRREREARRAQRPDQAEPDPEEESLTEKVVYGLLALGLTVLLCWVFYKKLQ